MYVWTVHWAHTSFTEWVEKGIAGLAGSQGGDQPAGELITGFRTRNHQLDTLGPIPLLPFGYHKFVFFPFVGDQSQILGVRGTLQSMSALRVLRFHYLGLWRGHWSCRKNTGHLQRHNHWNNLPLITTKSSFKKNLHFYWHAWHPLHLFYIDVNECILVQLNFSHAVCCVCSVGQVWNPGRLADCNGIS